MPFPVISLFKSRAGASETAVVRTLLWLLGGGECLSLPSPAGTGGWMCPLPLVQESTEMIKSTGTELAPSPVPCGVKQGPFLSSAPSPLFSQRLFSLGSSRFFHAGAFWATLLNTSPRTNYWLIRIIALNASELCNFLLREREA